VSFAAIILCVTSQRVFIVAVVYFVMTQSGNVWIHPRMWVIYLCTVILKAQSFHKDVLLSLLPTKCKTAGWVDLITVTGIVLIL
jgi:hypothetical protein